MTRRGLLRTLLGGFAAAATVPLLPIRPTTPLRAKQYGWRMGWDPAKDAGWTSVTYRGYPIKPGQYHPGQQLTFHGKALVFERWDPHAQRWTPAEE